MEEYKHMVVYVNYFRTIITVLSEIIDCRRDMMEVYIV